ncbi:MAG: PQ loop repeat-domain-containing protein [Piptocephalis tieghemiana]|nr:MAG: PQ loop repeat-domain-containing protein [Piptocephalis tieghemiana]
MYGEYNPYDRHANYTLNQVFGYFAFFFWSFQLAPQVWKNHKRRTTAGFSLALVISWFIGSILQGVYTISQSYAAPLILQPEVFSIFVLLCFLQYLRYDRKISPLYTGLIGLGLILISAALQVGLVMAVTATEERRLGISTVALGLVPSLLFVLGLIPQVIELFRPGGQGADALSLPFLAIDSLGALFSILSLYYQDEYFDWVVGGMFVAILIIDVIMIFVVVFFRFRQRYSSSHPVMATTPGQMEKGGIVGSVHPPPPHVPAPVHATGPTPAP